MFKIGEYLLNDELCGVVVFSTNEELHYAGSKISFCRHINKVILCCGPKVTSGAIDFFLEREIKPILKLSPWINSIQFNLFISIINTNVKSIENVSTKKAVVRNMIKKHGYDNIITVDNNNYRIMKFKSNSNEDIIYELEPGTTAYHIDRLVLQEVNVKGKEDYSKQYLRSMHKKISETPQRASVILTQLDEILEQKFRENLPALPPSYGLDHYLATSKV